MYRHIYRRTCGGRALTVFGLRQRRGDCSTNASVLQNNLFFGYGDTHNSDSKAPAPLCDAWANYCNGNSAIYPANQALGHPQAGTSYVFAEVSIQGLAAGKTCNRRQPSSGQHADGSSGDNHLR